MLECRQQAHTYPLKCNILKTRSEHKAYKIFSAVLLCSNSLGLSATDLPFHATELFSTHSKFSKQKVQKYSTNKKPIRSVEQKFISFIWNTSNKYSAKKKRKLDLTTLKNWCLIAKYHPTYLSQWPNSVMMQSLWLQWSCAGKHLSCTWPSAIIYVKSSLDKCQPCRTLKNKEKIFFSNHNMTRKRCTNWSTTDKWELTAML